MQWVFFNGRRTKGGGSALLPGGRLQLKWKCGSLREGDSPGNGRMFVGWNQQ